MKPELGEILRQLPSVDEVVRQQERGAAAEAPRWALVRAVQAQIDELREDLRSGRRAAAEIDEAALLRRVAQLTQPSLRPLINATGVVLHTNLGRAPLAARALQRLDAVARGYSNLEYRLDQRRRGSRHEHAAELLKEVCGAEDAAVVNNNAAAVLLGIAAVARGREVVVSRGELIEIGGSFRLPDVMALSGATLREVGTTNRTHLRDYEGAVGEQTALLLKVHRSNFALVGFTAEVDLEPLVELASRHGLLTMFDLGSGTLLDTRTIGLPAETQVQQAVAAGFDLVTFSGDKLLGGPQAGLIVGRKAALEAVRAHPLMRAVRPDKMTLAALEATLESYREGNATSEIPALAMLALAPAELEARADRLAQTLRKRLGPDWRLELVQVSSRVGGGAMPQATPRSFAVALVHEQRSADQLEVALRRAPLAVLGRIENDRLLLDVRTVIGEEQLADLVECVAALDTPAI